MTQHETPLFPRRAFLAAGLSAVFAGSAVGLAILGGASKVEAQTFQFSRGLALVNGEDARLRGFLSNALADERIHVTILGHTGGTGDAGANLSLSEERAAFAQAMAQEVGVPADRITATGLGGTSPLAKEDGETDRAYQSRLARVEVSLQMRK